MDRSVAGKLLRDELNQHGLDDWKARISIDHTHFLGLCDYKAKTIFLNGHHIDLNPDVAVINTIKHEVAHALTPGHNHDMVWEAKARELGCDSCKPCSDFDLPEDALDALRGGGSVEVSFTEEVVRKVQYKATRVQELCPDCGKPAKEKFSTQLVNRNGTTVRLITLECFHVITRVIPKATPFDTIVSNDWKPEVKDCKHDWTGPIKTQCMKCGEYKLYEFQVVSAKFIEAGLAARKGVGAFHEMGLGKTICSLAILRFHAEYTPVLCIVKSGLKFQWFKEIIRWLGPSYLAQVISTSRDPIMKGLKMYVISYDLLRRYPIERLQEAGFKLVIMDECQQIKNVDSGRTQAVRKLVGDQNIKVIPLSGTPWKNRGSEFFPVLNMMDPYRFNSPKAFYDRWVDYYFDGPRRKEGGLRNPAQFKEYVKDIIIRFERSEVMQELPLISRTKLHVQLDEIDQEVYDESVSDFVTWYNDAVLSGEEDMLDGLELLARMSRMRHIAGLAKIPATEAFVEEFVEDTDRKITIFVHHKDVGEILYDKFLKTYGDQMPVLRITGTQKAEERFEVQETFNKSPRAILVASTLAAGEGLNLQTGSDCIIHERQWNPANEEQAEGRFIRIGQTANVVTATYVEGEGTIDEHFDVIVEEKRRMFHAAMNRGEAPQWVESDLVKSLAATIVAKFKNGTTTKASKSLSKKIQLKPVELA